jgi:hypothetical protein
MGIKWFLLTVLIVAITACGNGGKTGTQFGQKIPANLQVVKLEQIVSDPFSYDQKEVILEGNFAGICCESDFFYKEGLETVEISPQGFPSPKLTVGTPVRIHGIVKTSSDRIRIEARGVEVK